ncbi:MAG: extracellular solute-binding protein [Clostridiales bacterium]|nr:extracellular solute-binding protein [Clostridiales bacterium]
MKKTTKILLSLTSSLLVAVNALSLTACGGDKGGVSGIQTGDVGVTAYDGSKVTITFYHSMGAALQDIVNDCVTSFNKIYPNVTVSHKSFGDYEGIRDQVKTELSTGRGPSLAACYPDHVALYNKSKAVLTLDDYIASDLTVTKNDGSTETVGLTQAQIDDYVPFYYEEGKMYGDNKMYTLPLMKSTELLYYNATYFQANNLKVPTTWEEMEQTCKKILEIENAKEGGQAANPCIPLGYDSGANWFITMTEQLESGYTTNEKGNHFAFNNETNRDFVKTFREWYEKDYVTTKAVFGKYTSDLFKETTQSKTKSFMCIGSSAGATYQRPEKVNDAYPFEVGVAMIPQEDPENPKMISQGPSICLFKKQNNQETAAAWLFAKYITTSLEYQARFSMNNGYTCAIQSVLQDEDVYASDEFLANVQGEPMLKNETLGIEAYGNENLQAASVKLTMEFAANNYYFVSPAFVGSSDARDTMDQLMKNAFEYPLEGKTAAEMIQGLLDKAYTNLKNTYDK